MYNTEYSPLLRSREENERNYRSYGRVYAEKVLGYSI
jgi:hypothetical protein